MKLQNDRHQHESLLERELNKRGAGITDCHLKDGRFYVVVEREYSVIPPLQLGGFVPPDDALAPFPVGYRTIHVKAQIEISFEIRFDYDNLAQFIRRYLDSEYEKQREKEPPSDDIWSS